MSFGWLHWRSSSADGPWWYPISYQSCSFLEEGLLACESGLQTLFLDVWLHIFCIFMDSFANISHIAPLLCSSDYLHVWVSISFYTSISQVKMLQNKYPREPIRNPPLQVWFLAYRTCACNFKSGIQCSFFFPLFSFYYIRIPYVYLKLLYQCCYFNNWNCTITKRSSKLLGKIDFL